MVVSVILLACLRNQRCGFFLFPVYSIMTGNFRDNTSKTSARADSENITSLQTVTGRCTALTIMYSGANAGFQNRGMREKYLRGIITT